MESLLIRVPNVPDAVTEWVVVDHNGQPHPAVRNGNLAAAENQSRQRRVVALAPSEHLVLNEITFPSRNRRKLRQAVPYILEDQFAEDVENLHFALGRFQTNSGKGETPLPIPVAAIQQETLDHWLAEFKNAKLQVKFFIPDVLALPYTEKNWSLLIRDEISLLRTGLHSGFACDSNNLEEIISLSLEQSETPPGSIKIWDYRQNPPLFNLPAEAPPLDYQSADADPLSIMARGLHLNGKTPPELNLLQGAYSPQEEYGQLLRPWRIPAILAACWLLLNFAGMLVELRHLSGQNEALTQQMQDIYKTTFPESTNLTHPKTFMEQKLKAMGVSGHEGGADFLSMLHAVATSLAQHNATLRALSYNKQQLDVELDIANVQALDQLKAEIAGKQALNVEIQAATPQDGKVSGRLRLTTGAVQ